jgi:nucleoside-diphosphate-sugar epimerase
MLAGDVPTIFGTGMQSRDFTSIRNVVSANLLACTAPSRNACGETFTIGTGKSQTLNTLYASLAGLLHFPSPAKYVASRKGDIERSQANISKARVVPVASFHHGLRATVDWYVDQQREREIDSLCYLLPRSA